MEVAEKQVCKFGGGSITDGNREERVAHEKRLPVACDTEFFVVSHTHWDREWYQSFESFRLRLVDLMDHLLEIYEEYPDYVFHLDAQTICLEDYLEIRPQHKERLKELISSGRLLVGPWYVQNDFHLTSGEATVRNLLIGSDIAREYGHCEKVGYAPDQFGLISQLPQIFKRFGINSAVFGRGYNVFSKDETGKYVRRPQPAEFEWVSPDGSLVQAIHLAKWYNNAQRFSENPERALGYLRHVNKEIEPFSTTPFRLLMNGVDHLEAQGNLLPVLERLQDDLGETATIAQSTFQTYIDRVFDYLKDQPVPQETGELRKGVDLDLLQGTLSSRPYLKALNSRCQTLLELEIEPLYAALAAQTGGRISYPADMMRYLWKDLMKNHPHDSICGCSLDRVHQDNENRFLRVLDAAEDLRQRGIQEMLNRIDRTNIDEKDYLISVLNPLPYPRSVAVTATVRLPLTEKIEGFCLLDPDGNPVAYEIVESVKQNRMTLSPFNLPGQLAVEELTLRFFAANIPPSGFAVYRLVADAVRPEIQSVEQGALPKIENGFLSLSVEDGGRVKLHDKQSGRTIDSLLSLEDTADLGDSYCCLPGAPADLSGMHPSVTVLELGELQQTLQLDYRLMLPAELNRETNERVGSVENRLTLTLTLRKNSSVLDVKGVVDNASKDHRLRLLVHTETDAESSLSAQPFDCIRRPRCPEQDGLNTDLCQPVAGWASVRNADGQVSVLTDGIYDYEYLQDDRHSLAFTCVRSTGRIINDLFGEDGNGVAQAPEWAAPENQCLRSISFHAGIRLGSASAADLFREQQCWISPMLTGFDSADPHKFVSGRPCVQSADLSEMFFRDPPAEEVVLPLRSAGLELCGDAVFSASKQMENREGFVFRLFNPLADPVSVELKNCDRWRGLMLSETPLGDWNSSSTARAVGPKEIVSLEIGCR
jgi:alpha-mannosidase